MSLARVQSLSISFGDKPVLLDASFAIDSDQRIALVGRNGTGKSTLLKILAGSQAADSGDVVFRQGVQVSYLPQDVPTELEGTIAQVVSGALGDVGQLLMDYQRVSIEFADGGDCADELSRLQTKIDSVDGWRLSQRIDEILSRMSLDGEVLFNTLSGGLRRRVLLAKALLNEPDILLLDEPTNHLDIPSIEWLEQTLMGLRCTLVFVTHDRAFLKRLANRIIELDRGLLTDWPGDHAKYLTGKAAALEAEQQQNALFDKRLAEEEAWIRQGIKARRTRNEGRVRALKKMRQERSQRIERQGTAQLSANMGSKSGKVVIEANNLAFGFDEKPVVNNFSTVIMRGDKVGVVGPNGVGKSTLVRLLLGELEAQSGDVKQGTNLDIAYFDQLRGQLRDDLSAMDNVSGGQDMVTVNGETKHIIGYLQDFLFMPERARAPITALSGGETNRLMLAKLFLKPSNFLVLDEPTNDLDVETLELLEVLVADYAGTVLVISHDREFLDNTVTGTLVFGENGKVYDYVGGYTDAMRQFEQQTGGVSKAASKTKASNTASSNSANTNGSSSTQQSESAATTPAAKPIKLSYKNQRELDGLPSAIEAAEKTLDDIQKQMAAPDFYTNGADTAPVIEAASKAENELERLFERWEALDSQTRDTGA